MNRVFYYLHIPADHLSARLQDAASADSDLRLGMGDQLHRLLLRQGIVHGLDLTAVDFAQRRIDAGEALVEPVAVAAGTPPVVGRRGFHPCFASVSRSVDQTDASGQACQRELLLVPLIRKGEVVAGPGPRIAPQTGMNIYGREVSCPFPEELVIEPGANVAPHTDGKKLAATVSGYPHYLSAGKQSLEYQCISIERLIDPTPGHMQAILSLIPPLPGHSLPNRDTIMEVLDEEGIVFGRLPQAIDHCLERCARLHLPQHEVVALGIRPVNGTDAHLRFAMEVGPLPGKIMGNGEIDFRERNMFVGVSKGQLIAVKIPPTEGIAGRDVFGEVVAALSGKDFTVRAMDDAVLDEATGELRALRNGVLSMVTDNSVRVSSHHVVARDVDFETGNIVTRDAVDIRGSIRPKFKVNALGDILIGGDVEKAMVRSDANVVVRGGVVGTFASVRARGDLDIGFAIQGRTQSGGKTILRQHGSYCRLHAMGDLHCNPSARIMASQLVAYGCLTTGTVGSDIATPSMLAAGVVFEQLDRYFELQRTIAEQLQAIEKMQNRKKSQTDRDELEELIEAHRANRKQFARLNLAVPKDQEAEDNGVTHALACTITVKGQVFAGTEIRIGSSRMVVAETLENVHFRLKEEAANKEGLRYILVLPNKKRG
ncbi:FapA family protein [Desulfobulbus sp.]|uniref:FapA family protein n=1 Tax=Desulfobulbus sp. TaxID=895 RepID=UPI00286F80AF|nr:FapA family protein [Desulfobulbus sp.]